MYIANVKTKNTWEDVEELVEQETGESFSFDTDTVYHLTNNSAQTIFLINTDTKPSENIPVGMGLPPGMQCDFKTGSSSKLFALSPINVGDLCVEVEG